MQAAFERDDGIIENEVLVAMGRVELNELRLVVSMAKHYLHPALSKICDTFLDATDEHATKEPPYYWNN